MVRDCDIAIGAKDMTNRKAEEPHPCWRPFFNWRESDVRPASTEVRPQMNAVHAGHHGLEVRWQVTPVALPRRKSMGIGKRAKHVAVPSIATLCTSTERLVAICGTMGSVMRTNSVDVKAIEAMT